MTAILERPPVFECPEIDGVMISLERAHDDRLADDYYRAIDMATGPRAQQETTQARIASILERLHSEDRFVTAALGHGAVLFDTPDLPQLYYGALTQIRELAAIDK